MLRRNNIVYEKEGSPGDWYPYGRVWKRIDKDRVFVIFVTGYGGIYSDDKLIREKDYRGFWHKDRFQFMTGLRKMKKKYKLRNNIKN